ncbi:MAG: ATP-binding protein [Bryobacterales bacterium]|nr:ATP-binding protein [Bryobacterales bacterium]
MIANDGRSLLLFDEMDDLLEDSFGGFGLFGPLRSSRSREAASKVFMHRPLEHTPAPTLWTMNDADEVSPAILRRMMFALELRAPTTAVRARVWTRQLDLHGIAAAPEEVTTLAAEFDAAPGVAAGATAAASLAGGDIAAVRTGVRSLARLLSCDRPSQEAPAGFDPALIQADTDPTALADRLTAGGRWSFSLCLQGPPGTGKSAYVRCLAARLGLEVVQKRASDLMSMWVGQTEKFIARAFAEARDAGAFLVFDEADSLLADRRFAQRNWEVSQVNEMLTWMESHPLPFACTTNFADRLDPATLRRFVFKVTLDYLSAPWKGALSQWVQVPPNPCRFGWKQPERFTEVTM